MPEEINRLLTDAISDLLWTPSSDADANLRAEGIPAERIDRIGNVMIDSLELVRGQIESRKTATTLGLGEQRHYAVVTLHRPATVDNRERLGMVAQSLVEVSHRLGVVFPVHPRTLRNLERFQLLPLLGSAPRIRLTEPMGYIDFLGLVHDACCVITDSGGLQEETTYLGIPCLTLRDTTERPITITEGTSRLVTTQGIADAVDTVLSGDWPRGRRPELWDGNAAQRAVHSLCHHAGYDSEFLLSPGVP